MLSKDRGSLLPVVLESTKKMRNVFGMKQINAVTVLEPDALNIAHTITLYLAVQLSAWKA